MSLPEPDELIGTAYNEYYGYAGYDEGHKPRWVVHKAIDIEKHFGWGKHRKSFKRATADLGPELGLEDPDGNNWDKEI